MADPKIESKCIAIPKDAFFNFLKEQLGKEMKGFEFQSAHAWSDGGEDSLSVDLISSDKKKKKSDAPVGIEIDD